MTQVLQPPLLAPALRSLLASGAEHWNHLNGNLTLQVTPKHTMQIPDGFLTARIDIRLVLISEFDLVLMGIVFGAETWESDVSEMLLFLPKCFLPQIKALIICHYFLSSVSPRMHYFVCCLSLLLWHHARVAAAKNADALSEFLHLATSLLCPSVRLVDLHPLTGLELCK